MANDEQANLERIIQVSKVSHVLRPYFTPRLNAFHGWALGRSGRHAEAVALLEPAIRAIDDPLLPMLAGQLVASLVAEHRSDEARALLRELELSAADLNLDREVAAQLLGPR